MTVRGQLVIGATALFALRAGFSIFRTGPLVVADEAGYLLNARVLEGGVAGALQLAPFYRGGYSLVIAPLIALNASPATTYHLILIANAILAVALVPLIYLLLVRIFDVAPRQAVWPTLAAAAYPSITSFSQVALSENLLLPLFVLWLLLFGFFVDARTGRRAYVVGFFLGATAAALFAVHGRMIVTAALTVVALLVLTLRRRTQLPPAVLAVGVLAIGIALVRYLDDFLVDQNYGGNHPDEVGERIGNLRTAEGFVSLFRNLVGQSWYVAVATLGVIVLAAATTAAAPTTWRRLTDTTREMTVLALMLSTAFGLLVISALSFSDIDRPDMLIYGRYVEVAVPPLLALSLTTLTTARPPRRIWKPAVYTVGILVVATVVVAILRIGVHPPGGANRWNIASLPFLTLTLGPAVLAGAGAVAAIVIVALALAITRAPGSVAPLVMLLFLPTTAVVLNNPVLSGERAVYPPGWTSPGSVVPRASVVAYDTAGYDVFGLNAYQWFMPHSRFVLFDSRTQLPPATYVISSRKSRERYRSRLLWTDPGRDQLLYQLTQPSKRN